MRRALARLWRSFWGPERRGGEVHATVGAEREGENEGHLKARAHFWAELREGQREAEANRSRAGF